MRTFFTTLTWGLFAGVSVFGQNPIKLSVDATDVSRHLVHVQMTIPAKPGPMTLLYPEWLPGEHTPTGPVTDVAGLRITAAGKPVAWKRDSVNMFAFHVDVPAGADALEVAFEFISPPETGGFSSGSSATTELAVVSWNQLMLYPEGVPADKLQIQANLKVPNGWRYGSALPIARESGQSVEFQPASLTTVIDSPVTTGKHYRTIDIGGDNGIKHYLHLAADSDAAMNVPDSLIDQYKNLVTEAGILYNSRHYRSYHFLVTLSDHVAHFGLEHHESSDDRIPERAMVDESGRKSSATLLPHEFTHSWNGKYRRPSGLATGDYSTPMKGDLLWVYEGLTNYLGFILAPRSGLWSPEEFRSALATQAARLDNQSGRATRPLQDTATGAQLFYSARSDYSELRRGTDFYDEGTLIWLETDVMIRKLSNGAKSLDDFCKIFHGGTSGTPELKPYEFEDVVAALNSVQPYNWTAFLRARLDTASEHAPLGGIEESGWKLAYGPKPTDFQTANESYRKGTNEMYSLGLTLSEDGTVIDVAVGRPAQKAGLSPAVKLIAVNRRTYSATVLREAITASASSTEPVELLIKDGDYYNTIRVDYRGGARYPRLERDPSKPDLLSQIIAPRGKK